MGYLPRSEWGEQWFDRDYTLRRLSLRFCDVFSASTDTILDIRAAVVGQALFLSQTDSRRIVESVTKGRESDGHSKASKSIQCLSARRACARTRSAGAMAHAHLEKHERELIVDVGSCFVRRDGLAEEDVTLSPLVPGCERSTSFVLNGLETCDGSWAQRRANQPHLCKQTPRWVSYRRPSSPR